MFSLIWGMQPPSALVSDEVHVGNCFNPANNRVRGGFPGHRRIFTYSSLKGLLEYHGFKVEKLFGSGYHPFPAVIARFLSRIDPRHSVFLTVKARKV